MIRPTSFRKVGRWSRRAEIAGVNWSSRTWSSPT